MNRATRRAHAAQNRKLHKTGKTTHETVSNFVPQNTVETVSVHDLTPESKATFMSIFEYVEVFVPEILRKPKFPVMSDDSIYVIFAGVRLDKTSIEVVRDSGVYLLESTQVENSSIPTGFGTRITSKKLRPLVMPDFRKAA